MDIKLVPGFVIVVALIAATPFEYLENYFRGDDTNGLAMTSDQQAILEGQTLQRYLGPRPLALQSAGQDLLLV